MIALAIPQQPIGELLAEVNAELRRRIERDLRIENGTASRADKREYFREECERRMYDEVVSIVNSEVQIVTETLYGDTSECWGSKVQEPDVMVRYVANATVNVQLEKLELRGWYLEKFGSFSGSKDDCGWEAELKRYRVIGKGKRRIVELTLTVKAT